MNQAAKVQDAKGPLVWLDMDQKALDDAYDQMVYAPNRDQVHKRNMFNSDRVRARLGAPKRVAYGPTATEQLDICATTKTNAPLNVFIHCGPPRLRRRRAPARTGRGASEVAREALGRRQCRRANRGGVLPPGSQAPPRAAEGLVAASMCRARRPARISPAAS